jgi:ankyrin repeat protein
LASREELTSWFVAVTHGDTDTIKKFIDQEFDVDVRTNQGRTALMLAARCGHSDVVTMLIGAHADLDERWDDGAAASLAMSTEENMAESTDEKGEDAAAAGLFQLIGSLEESGDDSAHAVSSWDEPTEFEEDLLEPGDISTALHHAVAYKHVNVVRLLVDAGAMITFDQWDVIQPVVFAAANGNVTLFDILVEAGAEIEPELNTSALEAACEHGHPAIARRCIELGVGVNQRGEDGETPLMLAAYNGHLEVVRFLVESGADVNAWEEGETALLGAVLGGYDKIAAYLDPLVNEDIRDFVRESIE